MTNDTPRVRLKPIALPSEHGSWGFLFEPILLGLFVASSFAGAFLALAVIAAFLLRNPVRIVLRARRRSVQTAGSRRVAVARSVALVYGAVSVAAAAACVAAVGFTPWWPLIAASPLGVAYVVYDSRNQGRSLWPELLGPVALAASAPSIAIASGWTTAAAVALWAVVVVKALPTVVYVRARLRLEDGERVSALATIVAHFLALLFAAAMVRRGMMPWPTLAVLAVLTARGALGLSQLRRFHTPKQIGISEFVYSGVYVVATAIGYYAAL